MNKYLIKDAGADLTGKEILFTRALVKTPNDPFSRAIGLHIARINTISCE